MKFGGRAEEHDRVPGVRRHEPGGIVSIDGRQTIEYRRLRGISFRFYSNKTSLRDGGPDSLNSCPGWQTWDKIFVGRLS